MRLGLDLGGGVVAAHWLCHVFDLGGANAELQRDIAIALLGTVGDDLAIVDAQHCHRHVIAVVGKDAAHAELLRDEAGTHRPIP